jgi:hypothetical protein
MSGYSKDICQSGTISTLSRTPRERPRVKLDQIVYVNLSSGNGGILLDVSEKGLSFQTADRLEDIGPISFRFLVPSIAQVEITGDLIWADETRKKGGVRFTNLPAEVYKEIQNWLGQTRPDAPNSRVASAPSISERQNPFHPFGENQTSAFPTMREPVTERSSFLSIPSDRLPQRNELPLLPTRKLPGSIHSNEPQHDGVAAHRLAMIAVTLVVGVAIGASSFVYKDYIGRLLISLGEKISVPTQNSPVGTPSPPVPSISQSLPVPDFGNPSGAVAAGAYSEQPPAKMKGSEASKGDDDGQTEFSLARQYLTEASNPEAKTHAAELLWVAVEKGSSDAEVELADLYGRGEGVPKNCQQARILLVAARNGNNPFAGKESVALHGYGCE